MRKQRRGQGGSLKYGVAVLAALVLGVSGCAGQAADEGSATESAAASTSPASPPTEEPAPGPPIDLVQDLSAPWSGVVVDDSVLVTERHTGRILEVSMGGDVREVAVVSDIVPVGEGGLLGLTVAEDWLFVYSTGPNGNRVLRYDLVGTSGSLGVENGASILDGLPASSYHNGGRIEIGPDGLLYVAVGDAGVPNRSQNLDSLGGKILRMNLDGSVPSDNPFAGSLVYSLGHRNVQGMAWVGERMFASEFGQNTWDEFNEIVAGGNYGWPTIEGIGGESQGFVDPLQVWAPSEASPSGLVAIGGDMYLANLRGERLRHISVLDPTTSTEYLVGEYGRLRDALLGPDGRLWVLTSNHTGPGVPRPGDDRIVTFDLRTLGM